MQEEKHTLKAILSFIRQSILSINHELIYTQLFYQRIEIIRSLKLTLLSNNYEEALKDISVK